MKAGHILLLLIGFIAASHLRREMLTGNKQVALIQQAAGKKDNQAVSQNRVTFNQYAATINMPGKAAFQRHKLNTQ